MSIQMECFMCHRRFAIARKQCKCGVDMVAAKKLKRTNENKKAVRYWVQVRRNGKLIRLNPADYNLDPFSLNDAKKLQARFITAKHEDRLEIFDKKIESTWTFQDLVNWYFEQPTTEAKKSCDTLKCHTSAFCKALGNTKLSALTTTELDNYRARRERDGIMPGTVNQEIWTLRGAVRAAVNDKRISADIYEVFKRCKRGKVKKNERVLTVEEFGRIHDKASQNLKPALICGFWSGARTMEVVELRWHQVRLKEGVIEFKTLKKEGEETRMVPMAETLREAMEKLSKVRNLHNDHVFAIEGKREWVVQSGMRTAVEAAGLEYGRKD